MDIASLIIIGVALIIWLWLVVVAIVALKYDNTLETFQRNTQIIIVLIVPFFGSALIIHLVKEHYPEAIPEALIPWPFKSLIYGKAVPGNKNKDNNEESGIDLAISNGHHSHNDYGGGGDGGGSD